MQWKSVNNLGDFVKIQLRETKLVGCVVRATASELDNDVTFWE